MAIDFCSSQQKPIHPRVSLTFGAILTISFLSESINP